MWMKAKPAEFLSIKWNLKFQVHLIRALVWLTLIFILCMASHFPFCAFLFSFSVSYKMHHKPWLTNILLFSTLFPWKSLINRDYRSISQFFTRQLRPGVRTISTASCMVSPVDGTVLHFGLANGHQIEQVSFQHFSRSSYSLEIAFWIYFELIINFFASSRSKVKGINYNLQHFLGPMNGSKDGSSIKIHNSEVKTRVFNVVHTSMFFLNKHWSRFSLFLLSHHHPQHALIGVLHF